MKDLEYSEAIIDEDKKVSENKYNDIVKVF